MQKENKKVEIEKQMAEPVSRYDGWLEDTIVEIIKNEGGEIPAIFFANTVRRMVDEGRLKVVFQQPDSAISHKYSYQVAKV